jgi:hypothetical protein
MRSFLSDSSNFEPPMTQPNADLLLLPGVPTEYVIERLNKAGGNEVGSGKLTNPHSSAALAANTFGWFHGRPDRLPPFPLPGCTNLSATHVEVGYCARFPWRGGRHPWLDAWVETVDTIIGIESKRFEPFRDQKKVNLSEAYATVVFGMTRCNRSKI